LQKLNNEFLLYRKKATLLEKYTIKILTWDDATLIVLWMNRKQILLTWGNIVKYGETFLSSRINLSYVVVIWLIFIWCKSNSAKFEMICLPKILLINLFWCYLWNWSSTQVLRKFTVSISACKRNILAIKLFIWIKI